MVIAVLSAAAVFGVAKYVRDGHQFLPRNHPDNVAAASVPDSPVRERIHRKSKEAAEASPGAPEIYTYRPDASGDKVTFTREPVQVPEGQDPKVFVVNKFLDASKIAPHSAALLSIDVRDGVAYLYFNGDMDTTFGTDDESTFLNGILTTLGQFPDVKSALFFAQGKQIDSFGNVDLSEAQPVIRDNS
jgi:hypothetical protein